MGESRDRDGPGPQDVQRAASPAAQVPLPGGPIGAVLALQRSAGNRATAALLRAGRPEGSATSAARRPLVQRDLHRARHPSQSDTPQIAAGVQGLHAGLIDPDLALYAFGEGATLAIRNVHQHLGDPRLPANHSVEAGSARVGPGNALRHCTWAAAVGFHALRRRRPEGPQDRTESIDAARHVLLAHEPAVFPGETRSMDSRVDMHNNETGLAIAASLAESPQATTEQLLARCVTALDDGELQMLDPAGTGRIMSTESWQRFGTAAWAHLGDEGVRPGVPAQEAERRSSERTEREGDVGRLGDALWRVRLHPNDQVLGLMSALAIVDNLSASERQRALATPAVVEFLADPAVPATVREQVHAALQRSTRAASAVPRD